jgi:hypothetical protein
MTSWNPLSLAQVASEFPSWQMSREFGEYDAWTTLPGGAVVTVHGLSPVDLRNSILRIVRSILK